MTKFLLGVTVGYMFHGAIDKVIATVTTSADKVQDKAEDKVEEVVS